MSLPIDAALHAAVAKFQRLQRPDGSVGRERAPQAEPLLRQIQSLARPLYLATQGPRASESFDQDLEAWVAMGLHTPPGFDQLRDALRPPGQGEAMFALMPVLATNGPQPRGHFLEYFLAVRNDPPECDQAAQSFPHPRNKCQAVQLLQASRGFEEGNCLVFFPENIRTQAITCTQKYALFFFSKFHSIFHGQTMPLARKAFGARGLLTSDTRWHSEQLTAEDTYRARSLWGYLHDYFHHQGPRPLDTHLPLKCRWSSGLLEEIKVDAQVVLACLDARVAFAPILMEFVLLERLLRYPSEPDALRTFDAASGVLLWAYLAREGALRPRGDHFTIDARALRKALGLLVTRIETLECEADDEQYLATALAWVREYLPGGAAGDRFAFPADYAPASWIHTSRGICP